MRRQKHLWTKPHIWSSKQTFGAMTFAAPDTKRKAKCLGGHGAESPHLNFRGRGSPETHSTFITANAGKRRAKFILAVCSAYQALAAGLLLKQVLQ